MTKQQTLQILKKYKVTPSTERPMPLFSGNCFAHSYTHDMKSIIGFVYPTFIFIGRSDHLITLLSTNLMAKNIKNFFKKNKQYIHKFLDDLHKQSIALKREYRRIEKIKNPKKYLTSLLDYYPRYSVNLGIYNTFWRGLSHINDEKDLYVDKYIIDKIKHGREYIAPVYYVMDQRIIKETDRLGKQLNLPGAAIRSMTVKEMQDFLSKGNIGMSLLDDLKKRTKQYLYIYLNGKDYIFTDKSLLAKVKRNYFLVKNKRSVSGHIVYKGKVSGRVYNKTGKGRKPKTNFIFVAPMTSTVDMPLIKKAAAIVTNEGGILCHAAIVARELKKACIISTKFATRIFKDGDLVEVDANQGIVKKL